VDYRPESLRGPAWGARCVNARACSVGYPGWPSASGTSSRSRATTWHREGTGPSRSLTGRLAHRRTAAGHVLLLSSAARSAPSRSLLSNTTRPGVRAVRLSSSANLWGRVSCMCRLVKSFSEKARWSPLGIGCRRLGGVLRFLGARRSRCRRRQQSYLGVPLLGARSHQCYKAVQRRRWRACVCQELTAEIQMCRRGGPCRRCRFCRWWLGARHRVDDLGV
jgi:hypothetical protein